MQFLESLLNRISFEADTFLGFRCISKWPRKRGFSEGRRSPERPAKPSDDRSGGAHRCLEAAGIFFELKPDNQHSAAPHRL
jgi:hypothetical protein